MKLGERIENLILYAAMCLVKTQAHPSLRIINSTGILGTELESIQSWILKTQCLYIPGRTEQSEMNVTTPGIRLVTFRYYNLQCCH